MAGAVQYGNRTDLCDYMKKVDGEGDERSTDEQVAQRLVDYGNENDNSPKDYDRKTVASTKIDVNSSGRPWNYQVCTEYGWFQTMSQEHKT